MNISTTAVSEGVVPSKGRIDWDHIKAWRCDICGKATTSATDGMDASPEHVSHRGFDIGTCKGTMKRVGSMA